MNTKILASLVLIGIAISGITMGTVAYFSDIEKSTGNTFTAGSLDLKVDSTCHYWQYDYVTKLYVDKGCGTGAEHGNWALDDLSSGVHKFFNFVDIKPGDYGEDTVSLHVYDNDAWGRLVIGALVDTEGSPACTEPESAAEVDCPHLTGELRQNLLFKVWLDEGAAPGFQNSIPGETQDPTEGDNIRQAQEPILITEGPIDAIGETWDLAPGLIMAYNRPPCTGLHPEKICRGLTSDGHLVGSVTYYFGIGWILPSTVGNEAQTDVFGGDMTFQVVQYRNNPTPSWT